ncbi:MAG: CBS domain-containing protein, partial [Ruminococcaceae bacterium]|nr:CBS domain-containing protein [Oscillospiraceae bacterium]
STATKEEIAQVFAETAYSRLPVYQESIDHIEGVIYQKDFHNYVYYTDAPVESIIRPVLMVPENKKISSLLKELQQKKSHIAVVIDEYGGTAGIVTLEDILEEIVGEIWDEHDEVSIEFEKISDEEYKVAGTYELSKLFEELDLEEEEDMPSTLNGFLMNKLERIPVEGDFVEYGGYRFTATQMDDKVAASLKIEKLPPEEETEEEDD